MRATTDGSRTRPSTWTVPAPPPTVGHRHSQQDHVAAGRHAQREVAELVEPDQLSGPPRADAIDDLPLLAIARQALSADLYLLGEAAIDGVGPGQQVPIVDTRRRGRWPPRRPRRPAPCAAGWAARGAARVEEVQGVRAARLVQHHPQQRGKTPGAGRQLHAGDIRRLEGIERADGKPEVQLQLLYQHLVLAGPAVHVNLLYVRSGQGTLLGNHERPRDFGREALGGHVLVDVLGQAHGPQEDHAALGDHRQVGLIGHEVHQQAGPLRGGGAEEERRGGQGAEHNMGRPHAGPLAGLLNSLPLCGREDGGHHFPRLGRALAHRQKVQRRAFVERLRSRGPPGSGRAGRVPGPWPGGG